VRSRIYVRCASDHREDDLRPCGSFSLRARVRQARRALDEQESAVTELRNRSGQLIAAAALTTSFFGGEVVHHSFGVIAWIAVGIFVALSLAVLAVLWPRHDWEFNLSPAQLIATYIEPEDGDPLPLPAIHRDLALHMGNSASRNRKQLRSLTGAFRLGSCLLVAEVVAWVIVLISQS
jgi:hypothetical protein